MDFVSGRFFFLFLKISMASKIFFISVIFYLFLSFGSGSRDSLSNTNLKPSSRLFSLIELSVSSIIFNLSKAILIVSGSSWHIIDSVNKCYNFTLCATIWWLGTTKHYQVFDKSRNNNVNNMDIKWWMSTKLSRV